jgi:hypothetical protein
MEEQGLHFVWPLPFNLSGMGGSTRSLRSRQHSFQVIGARKPPLHGKAVVLEESCSFLNKDEPSHRFKKIYSFRKEDFISITETRVQFVSAVFNMTYLPNPSVERYLDHDKRGISIFSSLRIRA